MFYIADGLNYRITEVPDEGARISNDVLMSNTDQPLLNDRYHIDNNHTFNYIAWFTSRDAAIQHLGKEAEQSIERETKALDKFTKRVARMEDAILTAKSHRVAREIQNGLINMVNEDAA